MNQVCMFHAIQPLTAATNHATYTTHLAPMSISQDGDPVTVQLPWYPYKGYLAENPSYRT